MSEIERLESELEDLKFEHEQECARSHSIRAQLDDAKSKAALTGDYSDSDWFRRAEGAKRACSRKLQQIQNDIGTTKRKIKQLNREHGESEHKCFVRAAFKMLDKTMFEAIMLEAKAMAQRESK